MLVLVLVRSLICCVRSVELNSSEDAVKDKLISMQVAGTVLSCRRPFTHLDHGKGPPQRNKRWKVHRNHGLYAAVSLTGLGEP